MHFDSMFRQRKELQTMRACMRFDPLGVVVPRTEADVVTVVKYAAENGLPLHVRGAGTGRAGESLGAGLVLDFSRYLRAIVAIGAESVIVQPGVVLDDLNGAVGPPRAAGSAPTRSVPKRPRSAG